MPATPAATVAPCGWLRAAFVAAGLGAWFWTQSLIGRREFSDSGVGDVVHQRTAGLHDAFRAHPQAANTLLIISSAVIDVVGVSLLAATLFGRTVRPFLGLLMLFALRQLCQMLCAFPAPPEMIWHNTGVPTLLVTYGISTDSFLRSHGIGCSGGRGIGPD